VPIETGESACILPADGDTLRLINVNFRYNNIGVMGAGEGCGYPTECELRVIKYHPNRYHGMLEEYLRSGWVDNGDSIEQHGVSLSKSVFSEKESYYTIAIVKYDDGEEYTRIEGVEDRLAWIEPNDYVDFFKAYRKAVYHLTGMGDLPVS
jgi:hypothetical protein